MSGVWASVGACAQPRLLARLTCREGPHKIRPPSARPPHLARAQLSSQRGLAPAACHPPAIAGQAQPEPAPAFTTMFKGLSKGSQGKGSPNKHSR